MDDRKGMALTPGQVLQNGRYTIDRELRRDLYSISYLARGSDGQPWVIKILDPAVLVVLSAEEQSRLQEMFMKEAMTLAACTDRSPYIVKVRPPFVENNVGYQLKRENLMTKGSWFTRVLADLRGHFIPPYVGSHNVMCLPFEYPGGTSLQDRSQRILKEETALEYIRQLSEAVEILHSQGLVHRDIRPANIFLRIQDNKAEAVLTDFDLVMDSDTVLSKTRTKERTDGFAPIELYSSGKPIGSYTDVYSLAATLYEMLTGTTPVSAESRKVDKTPLESPQVKNPEISGRVAKAILAGMEIWPEQRPKTLQAWLKQLGLGETSGQGSVVEPEVNWGKWGVIWAVIIGIFAAIPAWLALKPEPVPPTQPTPTTQPTP